MREKKIMREYRECLPRIPESMKELQRETNIYIYGWRNTDEVYRLLQNWGVEIKGVLFSKSLFSGHDMIRFMASNMYAFLKKRDCGNIEDGLLLNYETILNDNENIVLIAEFNLFKYKELATRLSNENKIKALYVIKGISYLEESNFRFPTNKKIQLVDNYYRGLLERDLSFQYFQKNETLFKQTYEWLFDELSKQTMERYLEGHIELTNFPMKDLWEYEDVNNQYFPLDIIRLGDDEIFVDCGAYTGDTLENFLKRVKKFEKYYALEPDKRRRTELKKVIKRFKGEGRICYIPIGAWDRKEELCFSLSNECGEIVSDNKCSEKISVDAIDNVVDEDEKVTFIKMDIEGAELKALEGARNTILRWKPKLAICVYHKREDLITIPQFIKSIDMGYKLYLRAHYPYCSELVLYAIYE